MGTDDWLRELEEIKTDLVRGDLLDSEIAGRVSRKAAELAVGRRSNEPLAAKAFTADELDAIADELPCLFHVDDGRQPGLGMMPRGYVGMLVGAPGAGKSYLALEMLLAAANGGILFHADATHVSQRVPYVREANRGRVLYVSLEDNRALVGRRLKAIRDARSLAREFQARVHVVAWDDPEIGSDRTLFRFDPRASRLQDMPLYARITALLESSEEPWSLIVVDTLARCARGDVETNAEAATDVLQRLEEWTKVKGNPTVLIVHHSRKSGPMEKRDKDRWLDNALDAESARGTSAINGTARWLGMVAKLPKSESTTPGLPARNVFFQVAKANGVADDAMARLHLVPEKRGVLRVATRVEVDAMRNALSPKSSSGNSIEDADASARISKSGGWKA